MVYKCIFLTDTVAKGQLLFLMLCTYLNKIYRWIHAQLSHVQSFQPTQLGEIHGKDVTPYCIPNYPVSLSLTYTVRNHSLTASTPTKVKMNALATCGGSRTREWERTWEKKKRGEKEETWKLCQSGESVKQDAQTLIVYVMSDLMDLSVTKYMTIKAKSCN